MIAFFVLVFALGALGGGGAVALFVAGARYDEQHAHRHVLDALERIWERS